MTTSVSQHLHRGDWIQSRALKSGLYLSIQKSLKSMILITFLKQRCTKKKNKTFQNQRRGTGTNSLISAFSFAKHYLQLHKRDKTVCSSLPSLVVLQSLRRLHPQISLNCIPRSCNIVSVQPPLTPTEHTTPTYRVRHTIII